MPRVPSLEGRSPSRRRSLLLVLGKGLRIAAIVALAGELVYLVAANTILLTDILERFITDKAKEVTLRLGPSWSLFPGRVQARELDIVVETKDAELELAFPEATIHIALLDLFRREFHATRVHGRDFRLKVRGRSTDRPEAIKNALPPITGLPSPPAPEPPPRLRKGDADRNNNFAIHLEDVDLAMSELWLSEYRYAGKGQVQGAFYFRSEWAFRIAPSRVAFQGGSMTFGRTEPIARSFDAEARSALHELDLSSETRTLWTELDASVVASADVASVAFLGSYFGADVRVRGGSGTLEARGRLVDGSVEGGSVDYRTPDVALGKGPLWAGGAVTVSTLPSSPPGTLKLDLEAPKLEITRGLAEAAVIGWLTQAAARLELANVGGRGAPALPEARARIGHIEIPDIGAIVRALELPVDISGPLQASAGVLLDRERLDAVVDAATEPIRVAAGNVIATAWADIDARFEGQRSLAGRFTELSARLTHATFRTQDEHVEDWWATVDGRKFRVDSWRAPTLSSELRAHFKNAEPLWMYLEKQDTIPPAVDTFLDLPDLTARVDIARSPQGLDLRIVEAHSSDVHAWGRLSKGRRSTCSAFLVDGPLWSVGVSALRVTNVRPLAGRDWLARKLERCRPATSQ